MTSAIVDWWRRLARATRHAREAQPASAPPPRRPITGAYQLLYKYLAERYANTVVLTFGEIEDLLGFTLPEQARRQQEWWTTSETSIDPLNHSDSWLLADRTARPNLLAQTVVFERTS